MQTAIIPSNLSVHVETHRIGKFENFFLFDFHQNKRRSSNPISVSESRFHDRLQEIKTPENKVDMTYQMKFWMEVFN